jgi:hypothetical protein
MPPWESAGYDYKNYGIIGEPYLDVDFTKVVYLTDTGRRWNGERFSVRDKELGVRGKKQFLSNNYSFRTTNDIIKAALNDELPDQIMITLHSQRWTNRPLPWLKELVWQNAKNLLKRIIIQRRIEQNA